jgi:hypothetical protein
MPEYFEAWLERTRELERQRNRAGQDPGAGFPGFGRSGREGEDWLQWMEFVAAQINGDETRPGENDEDEE